MNCFGTYKWVAKGSEYEGQWKDGKMDGFGVKTRTTTNEHG